LHLDEVPQPELAPDEAIVAVMASSVNFKHGVDIALPSAFHVRVPAAPRS